MPDKERELLIEVHEITSLLTRRTVHVASRTVMDGRVVANHNEEADKAIVAKLKALGYEQVWTKCPECKGEKSIWLGGNSTVFSPCPKCKGTGRKRKLVEWDREKVAEFLWETYRPPTWVEWKLASNMHLVEETRQTADQLHKVLTGEK